MTRVLSLLIVLLAALPAMAREPEDVFAGKIMTSDAPFPRTASSKEDFINKIKSRHKDRFQEDKEEKQWRVFIAAFFAKPVTDLEVTIKIYDVTSGQRLVETFEQMVGGTSPRAYVSDIKMKRGDGTSGYDPMSKIHMVIENHGHMIAETTFQLIGEPRHYSGKVDMSDESK
jgi:hypothetical protein